MRNYIFAFPERQKFTGYSYSLTREKIMTNPRRTGDSSGDAGTDTWLDLPAGKIGPPSGADIAILGIGAATPYPGGSYCMEAPDAVRQALRKPGLLGYHDFDLGGLDAGSTILPDGITAEDQGNLQVDDTVDPEKTAANRARITAAVRAMLDSDTTPVLFGGDDSVPIPVLAAYAGTPSVSILQIDAHIDSASGGGFPAPCGGPAKWITSAGSSSWRRGASARRDPTTSEPRSNTAPVSTRCGS